MRFNQLFNHAAISMVIVMASTAAMATEFTIDPVHSNVGFTIRHLMSHVSGAFTEFGGDFTYDDKKPESSKGTMTIQSTSISTNNKKRDDHLRSADFFDVAKYPTITFVSKKVAPTGKNKFKIMGDMTIHGVTKPATWEAQYLGAMNDPFGGPRRASYVAHTQIKRKDFGIVWNKALDAGGLMLGDDVDLNVQVEAPQKVTEAKK